jgi:peptidoglycan hydrolase-like protein with peptidoglycan-binding domain
MPRHPVRSTRLPAVIVAVMLVLVACGRSSGVADGKSSTITGITAAPLTVPPVVTAPPGATATETTPETAGAENTAAVPIDSTPATAVPTEPSTVPPTEAPTTVPETTLPPTTIPETTVPPTTIPESFLLLEPAPPVAELVLAIGSQSGDGTRVVQQRLLDLGFWLSGVDGDYGLTTRQAVMAFQKYSLLPATGKVDQATADALTYAPFRARGVSHEGSIVEINKEMQVLFIIRDGKTLWALNTSTGNGQEYDEADRNTPGNRIKGVALTPDGLFKVNREKPEGWWEGDLGKIYRPKYFRGGIAVHGSGTVPNLPASHGCVRVSVPAMDYIWAENLMPLDTPVWVYGTIA